MVTFFFPFKDGEAWSGKHICTIDCVSVVVTILLFHKLPQHLMALSGDIFPYACRLVLCRAPSVLCYILVMWLVAHLHFLVFGLGLVVPLVKFFLLFKAEAHRNISEIVYSVRSMLRIEPLSPLAHNVPPASWDLTFETKIHRYSRSRSHKATISQDLFMESNIMPLMKCLFCFDSPVAIRQSSPFNTQNGIDELVRFLLD